MFTHQKYTLLFSVLGALTLAALSTQITPYMLVASANFFILWIGYTLRFRNKKLHAALMGTAILSDLSLVLVLELQRDAIATAISMKLSWLNQAHIYCSSIATVFYFPVLYYGFKLLCVNPTQTERRNHRLSGHLALFFRTLGFLLMFSMLQQHHS